MEAMSDISLEDLAHNILNDPTADSTAKLIAKMAASQESALSAISNTVMRIEGKVRRMDTRQELLLTELERAFEGGTRPDFDLIRCHHEEEPASNGHG